MKTRNAMRPAIESLESLALLSGASAAFHLHAHSRPHANSFAEVQSPITPAPLSGTMNGVFVGHTSDAQTGASYHFVGGGRVDPIGRSFVSGNVQVSSLATTGGQTSAAVNLNGNDTLYLRARGGRLTLHLAAPTPVTTTSSTSSSAHLTFSYTVTAATGAFQAEQGESGTINVSLRSFLPSFLRSNNFDIGRFAMTFSTTTATV